MARMYIIAQEYCHGLLVCNLNYVAVVSFTLHLITLSMVLDDQDNILHSIPLPV
jgi:hypothetical protein